MFGQLRYYLRLIQPYLRCSYSFIWLIDPSLFLLRSTSPGFVLLTFHLVPHVLNQRHIIWVQENVTHSFTLTYYVTKVDKLASYWKYTRLMISEGLKYVQVTISTSANLLRGWDQYWKFEEQNLPSIYKIIVNLISRNLLTASWLIKKCDCSGRNPFYQFTRRDGMSRRQTEMRSLHSSRDIIRAIDPRRLRWAGNVDWTGGW